MKSRAIVYAFFVILASLMVLSMPSLNAFGQESKKILSIEAFDMLNTVPDTYLIDVRTRAEYQFIGHPYKAYHFPYFFFNSKLVKKDDEYSYAYNSKNEAFTAEISKVFKKTDNILLISRDGTRSALAAKALLGAGFQKVFDVEDGFEGAAFPDFEDDKHHKYYRQLAKRNKIYGFEHRRHYGWQWWGLPWTYTLDPKFLYPPDLRPPKK